MSRLAVRWGVVLGLVVVLASAGHARAAGEVAVQVSIRPVTTVVIGTAPTVIVDLRVGGAALGNEPVELSVDGTYYRRERTAAGGSVTFTLPKDLVAGAHRLTAVYPGRTNAYLSASASATFEVASYELTVQTIPALPGMGFTLDGEPFEADAAGIASIPVNTAGDHVLVALASDYHVGGRQAQFARWSVNDEYASQVTVSVPKDGAVQAGFDVYQPASQVFVDPSGGAVEADRITSFTVRSSLGQVLTFPDGSERLYKASRVVRRSSGLESVDIRYNVTDVQVDGSNVVNAGQQQFYVTSNATWRISLLLFSARIQPKDALFGFTAGTSVEVIYPSGKSEVVKAGEDGIVVIPWLARGIYRVVVADAPGWAPAMPVALSRDQEVELRVVSYLDMGLAVVIALGVIFGLLHRGRPHLIPNTVRAVGGGVTGRLPVPAAVRPAVKPVQATAASPPEPAAAAATAATAEHKAPVKVEVAPILATIARRTDLGDLSKAPLAQGRQAASAEPVMDALAQFAPALLGLPQNAGQEASSEAASSGGGKGATLTTAKGVPDKPAPRRRASSRTAASADGVAADAKGAEAKGATARGATARGATANSASAKAPAAETASSGEGTAPASTARRRSKKATASPDEAPAARPRRTRRTASDESTESPKPTKTKRSRSRTSAKTTEAASSTVATDVAEKPKRSRRRSKAEPDAATSEADAAPKKRRSTRASATRKKDDAAASEQTASAGSTASTAKTAKQRTRATKAKAKAAEPADDTPVKKTSGTRSTSRTTSAKTAKPKAGSSAAKRTRATRSAKPAAKPAAAAAEDATTVKAKPTTGRIFRSPARASNSRGVQVNRLGIADPGRSPIDVPKKPGDEAPPVMQACANCGLELWVGARFCRRCGQPTVGMPAEAATEVPPSNANGRTPRRGGRRAADPALAAPPPSGTSGTRSSQRGGE